MSIFRQALLGIALLAAQGLLIWSQELRISGANKDTRLAEQDASRAREQAERNLANANALRDSLQQERKAQTTLRAQHDQLRQGLAKRELTIEALKRENVDLRNWAAQLLPDAARRLRERPALTGADAYRQWLSGRGAVYAAGDQPAQ
ncbi:Rz-like lysis system protein LysB [Pseudomonas sp. Irchel 3E19]|uniref:Rz-like lysis system protein LysB n=1 Tax=Pseudomonas sp. Irchel 3E19 TaxID=2008981 RepID=UPI000BA3E4E2|nr:Rz-like lysis system protein LysB [Pseudomonas sp. Irchel 3E19]